MALPKIQETARLFGDVELRFTPTGKAVASVPLVFNKRTKNRDTGEWEDSGSLFVRGTAWELLAENCAESLTKGTEVLVSGEMSQREYERKDGTKGTSLELHIYSIGPNLKTATAKVNKATRSSGSGGYAAADDPWGSAPPVGATAGAGNAGYEDEPPF